MENEERTTEMSSQRTPPPNDAEMGNTREDRSGSGAARMKRKLFFKSSLDRDEKRNTFLVKFLLFSVCLLWLPLYIGGEVYEVNVPSSKNLTGGFDSVPLNETYNYAHFVLNSATYIGWLSFLIQSIIATDSVKFESPQDQQEQLSAKQKISKHIASYQIDLFMILTAVLSGLFSSITTGRQNGFSFGVSFLFFVPFLFVCPLIFRMLLVIRRQTFLNHSKNNGGVKDKIYLNAIILVSVLFVYIMGVANLAAKSFNEWSTFKFKQFPGVLTDTVSDTAWQESLQLGFIEGQVYSMALIHAVLSILAVLVPSDLGWIDRRMRFSRSLAFTILFISTIFVLMFFLALGNKGKRTIEGLQIGLIVWNCLFGLMGVCMVFPLLLSRLASLTASAAGQEKFDVFLTHDWGKDEKGRNNHSRVAEVNRSLKAMGFKTWFDEQRLTGNIQEQMAAGIENSAVVVVFITKRYIDKVGLIQSPQNPHPNPNDNCKREFLHAVNNKTARLMIPVVMEDRVTNSSKWEGPVGFNLGSELYINLISNENLEEQVNELGKLIEDKLNSQKPDTTDAGHQERKAL